MIQPAENSNNKLSILFKFVFLAIFFSTGFSALIYQVIWQRILTLHAGVDLYSVTTVVAAFMAGLGLGSLAGGYIADRLSIRNCFVFFAISNLIVGIFGFWSLWFFYDVYSVFVHYLNSPISFFLFHFVLLCIPTIFMGMSMPLLSKSLVRTRDEMSSLVGGLYGMNTLGAAAGACLGTWYMMGTFGFSVSTKIASSINIVSGLIVILMLFKLKPKEGLQVSTEDDSAGISDSPDIHANEDEWIFTKKPAVWISIYGLTGFVALSLEIVWFRVLNIAMGATSYVFGNMLFIYLCGVGLGSLVSSLILKRIKRPDLFFFSMQYLIGLLSLLSLLILIYMPSGIAEKLIFAPRMYQANVAGFKDFAAYFIRLNIATIFIFGLPTLFMGMCFPLIQQIVSRQMKTLGRNLSKLLFSNIVGNILGSLFTGFLFLEFMGTPLTLKVMSGLLIVPGLIGGYSLKNRMHRFLSIALVLAISFVTIATFPGEKAFWRFFHRYTAEEIYFKEDNASLNALMKFKAAGKEIAYNYRVYVNGRVQSEVPFVGMFSLWGIAPALYHPNPKTGFVIGFGSGSTLYAVSSDKRLEKITCVELSGGQIELMMEESQREPSLWQVKELFDDPRVQIIAGDGRKFLLNSKEKFDIIEIDAIVPTQAYSGNLYSVEFFELVRQRLQPGGILSQWIPTPRVEKSIMKVFPYVVRFNKLFVLAGNEPIRFNKAEIMKRLEDLNIPKAYGDTKTGRYLSSYFTTTFPDEIQSGSIMEFPNEELNLDFSPRDEYFINNKRISKNLFQKPAD